MQAGPYRPAPVRLGAETSRRSANKAGKWVRSRGEGRPAVRCGVVARYGALSELRRLRTERLVVALPRRCSDGKTIGD